MDPHRSGNGQIWALTLSVFIDLEYLGGKESIDFEVFRTTHGFANKSPPVLPLPSEMTLCPKNISLIYEWIHDCETNHPSCKKIRTGNFLPTRLTCVKSGLVYLIETEQFSQAERQLVQYLALSHCWGPEKAGLQYKTTSQNIQSRLGTMVLAELPQNIKDAISVGRALGVDYLWIDSICIVQDSPQDLAAEMKIMLEVYSNAYLTISATSAESVEGGFLQRTQTRPRVVIPREFLSQPPGTGDSITIFTGPNARKATHLIDLWRDEVENSPWNQRAWTLQEALISPRIVHFGKERLFFECSVSDCLEGAAISSSRNLMDPYVLNPFPRPTNILRQQLVLTDLDDSDPRRIKQIYDDYYSTIQEYTRRKLTFIQDRAAACSSIMTAFIRIAKTAAYHGILLSDMRRGFYWHGPRDEPSSGTQLDQWPSWSWLSYPGEVGFLSFKSSPAEEEGIGLQALDDEAAQNFEIGYTISTDKRLCLRAFLIQVSSFRKEKIVYYWDGWQIFARAKWVAWATLDYQQNLLLERQPMPYFLLSIGSVKSDEHGLLVKRHDKSLFRRIGSFQWRKDEDTRSIM